MNSTKKEISCRITRTLLMYVREKNNGSIGHLLEGLNLDEEYLMDPNHWVAHAFLQILYHRMIDILDDENAVYNMTLASERFSSLGLLDKIVRLLGNPRVIYAQAPKYNRLLKLNGDVYIHAIGKSWVLLEDRYHRNSQKTRFDCDYTRGILAGIPSMFNLPMAHVQELECQVTPDVYGQRHWPDKPSQGCKGCLYRVSWTNKTKDSFFKYLFRRQRIYRKAIEDLLDANRQIQAKYTEIRNLAQELEAINTQLIESKANLEAERKRLAITLKSIAEGVISTDQHAHITLINRVAEKLTGWEESDAIGMPLNKVFRILNTDSRQLVENPVQEMLVGDKIPTRSQDAVLIGKQDCENQIVYSAAPILDARDDVIGIVLVIRDITRERIIEKELQKMEKLESIGVLAGGIAHDFNNFLTGIIGNVSLAKLEVKPSAEIYPRLDDMEKAALRATTLTQQLLTFSKGGEPVKKLTEIATLVKESAKFALRGSNVSCKFDFQSNLAFCSVDEGQISQVIHNIVLNADQAMPDGGIIFISGALVDLAAENELSLAPGEYVLLTVEDQGQGIKKELIDKIFDPYFSTKKKGMGLGLAVAHSIIVKHKGRINVDSVPGRGTRFDIYLPVTSKAESLDQPARRALKNGEGKILVMDDELFIRELVAEMLKAAGYQVALATDGQDAVQLYQTAMQSGQAFDAVVLDLTIPGAMGGKRTVCKLKEIDPMVKAIVSSGYSHDPVMSDFKSYGFQGAVKKPYKVKELCAVLDRVLNNT